MKRTSKKTALTQTTEEYASRSSIHGIGYAFDRELNVVDRLLWLLVVLAFLGIAAALSWDLWSQWQNEQVIKTTSLSKFDLILILVTTLKNTVKLVTDIPSLLSLSVALGSK